MSQSILTALFQAALYQHISQLGPNIDPRKLLAAAAAAGKLSSLQNATAPATQVLPTETQNKPKRPSGPKSILESRLFKVSTCIFFFALYFVTTDQCQNQTNQIETMSINYHYLHLD